jgi:hypothetical protein
LADGRHATTSSDGPNLRVLIGGGVAILVVLGIAGYLVFGRNKGVAGESPSPVSASPVAGFQFDSRTVTLTVDPEADKKKAKAAAEPVAKQVVSELNTLYGEGFVDTARWQAGTYDDALAVFDTGAQAEARTQLDVLTAGAAAGTTFASISAPTGKLAINVLVDTNNRPQSASGAATFTASVIGKDGSAITIRSQGQFIFRAVNGDWKIVSFNVTRSDQSGATSPTATGSPTP